jgi:hypothetical protein
MTRSILAAAMLMSLAACARLLPAPGAPDPVAPTPTASVRPSATPEATAVVRTAISDIDEQMRISDMIVDADAVPIEEALQDSPHYGGLYLDWTLGGVIVVSLTSESARGLVPRTPHSDRVTIRIVEHSQAELYEIFEAVSDAMLRGERRMLGLLGDAASEEVLLQEKVAADINEVSASISDNAVVVSFARGSSSAQAIAAGDAPEEYVRAFGARATKFRISAAGPDGGVPFDERPSPAAVD